MVLTTAWQRRRLLAMEVTPATEARNVTGAELDLLSTTELVMLMNREDALVPLAVGAAGPAVVDVVDAVAERLRAGGRLVYAGAGTSGSLAALDASECEATFGIGCDQVVAAVAGAGAQSSSAREAAEDDETAGRHALEELNVGAKDAVVAVSASGGTPFTLGAARAAAAAGAFTACVVCVPHSQLAAVCEREIMVLVGPEVLAGSTRLKAGTAQKLVLNTISTVAMMRLGKTYAGLMVGVVASNEKLRERVRRIVSEATGAPSEAVDAALAAADGDARVAIVSLLGEVDAASARTRLEAAGGNVREALGR
jgi:N-acetylmuramic acid 6-phosphate etherase